MYKINYDEQGSDAWFRSRLGKITASNFSKVITATGKASAQVDALIDRAVAERLTGQAGDFYTNSAMERGKELESEAFASIVSRYDLNFDQCGSVDAIDEAGESLGYSCSPDGINEADRMGLEIKCPLQHTHISYLRKGELPSDYVAQVQGAMLVTGFERWAFCSYHPLLPSLFLIVERDEKYIQSLKSALDAACEKIKELEKQFTGDWP
jgi:hypothetical protein